MHTTIFDNTYAPAQSPFAVRTTQHGATNGSVNESIDWQQVVSKIGEQLWTADSEEQARLYHRLGYVALTRGDVRTKAMEAFTLMLERADRLEHPALQAMAHVGLSTVCDTLGQRYDSLDHARKAAELASSIHDQRLLALALNIEAQFYKENGQNRRAHELYQIIGQIGQELSDDELNLMSKIGMGRTTSMAAAATAIKHYEEAIVMAKLYGDDGALTVCYNNLADWKINTGCYQEALELRQECLRISRKMNSRIDIGRSWIGMAKAHTLMNNLSEARSLLNKGLPTVMSAGDIEGELHCSLNLAYLAVHNDDVPRACELYRQVLERSLAAPDHACALFAQLALEQLAAGAIPQPAILPPQPLTDAVLNDTETIDAQQLALIYPTGDRIWWGRF